MRKFSLGAEQGEEIRQFSLHSAAADRAFIKKKANRLCHAALGFR